MPAPKSAYLHVPFCRHRCGYCNFAVVAGRSDLIADYLRAIEIELGWLKEPRPVETLYFGGGTPTQLPMAELDQLLQLAKQWFPRSSESSQFEWTVEANPADLPDEAIRLLAKRGVTRISLGAQSFHDEKLSKLERDHTAEDIGHTVASAHDAGLEVSIDLIFAAPGETLAEWESDLEQAIALGTGHVSTYGLTYEQGTTFWSRRLKAELSELDEELQRDMYLIAIERLTAAGFEHYEVSNFGKNGQHSQHNEAYWAGNEYFAVGPGAARYVEGARETNHRSTTTYLKRVLAGESPVAEREELTDEERAHERLVFGLRRLEGIDVEAFAKKTGYEVDALAGESISRFVEQKMLKREGNRLMLTREGLLVSDAIWPELL